MSVQIATVRERTSIPSQIVTLVAVVAPPVGVASAMGLLWGVAFHWVDLILLVSLYVICAFGTTWWPPSLGRKFAKMLLRSTNTPITS